MTQGFPQWVVEVYDEDNHKPSPYGAINEGVLVQISDVKPGAINQVRTGNANNTDTALMSEVPRSLWLWLLELVCESYRSVTACCLPSYGRAEMDHDDRHAHAPPDQPVAAAVPHGRDRRAARRPGGQSMGVKARSYTIAAPTLVNPASVSRQQALHIILSSSQHHFVCCTTSCRSIHHAYPPSPLAVVMHRCGQGR